MVHRTVSLVVALAMLSLVPTRAGSAATLDPADPSLARPALDPNADAEIVSWDIRVVDAVVAQGFERRIEFSRSTMVYTSKGAEAEGTASFTIPDNMLVENQVFTVTTPGGRKQVIHPEQSYERVLIRQDEQRVRKRQFALPGVVPGTLVELDLRIRFEDRNSLHALWFALQQDVPIRHLELSVRPWVDLEFHLRTNRPDGAPLPVRIDDRGVHRLTVRDLTAFKEEPCSAPELETRLSVLGSYGPRTRAMMLDPSARTGGIARYLGVSDSLRALAAQLTLGASSADERLLRLHAFCRDSVVNVAFVDSLADAVADPFGSWERVRRDRLEPLSTLRHRMGSPDDINLLLAALASACGLDVRLALLMPPHAAAFDSGFIDPTDAEGIVVAVASSGGWRYANAGDPDLRAGWLDASHEGANLVMLGAGSMRLGVAPARAAEESRTERKAVLTIEEDGSATGVMSTLCFGHDATTFRRSVRTRGSEAVKRETRTRIESQFPGAQIKDVGLLAVESTEAMCGWVADVRLPDYASGDASVWVMPLDPFRVDEPTIFTSDSRRHPIYWPHASIESDSIFFQLPKGHRARIAPASAPASIPGVLESAAASTWHEATALLGFHWTRRIGTRGRVLLQPVHYKVVRAAFADAHSQYGATAQVQRAVGSGSR